MHQLIITNNPRTAQYVHSSNEQAGDCAATSQVDLLFCTSKEELYTQVRNYIHQNWKLENHALYGNIQLHKQPYRSMLLTKSVQLDIRSLQLWEQAMERVKRMEAPHYSEKVLEDFQALDFSLFSAVIADLVWGTTKF